MSHRCAAPGCDLVIADRLLMCRPHWFKVPEDIRRRIWRTYRPGQERDGDALPEYHAAVRDAVKAIRQRNKQHV